MNTEMKKAYEEIITEIFSQKSIPVGEIPNIDVYMDQLTTFMDERLRAYTRDPLHDKVLTKTMINNYTKNNLLPPPKKKKYSRDHLILLIFIFYLKRNFSIEDTGRIIEPLKKLMGPGPETRPRMADVYSDAQDWSSEEHDRIRDDLNRLFDKTEKLFPGLTDETGDELRRFAFLITLANEIRIRQALIERLLDMEAEEE